MDRPKALVRVCFVLFAAGFTFLSNGVAAQAPSISYSPSTNIYNAGTAITPLTPSVGGGAVASFAFGTGVTLTGATLSNPYGIGIDGSGNIYVANYGNNTVSKYNSAGSYTGTFGSSQLSNPSGITFDASGFAYVLNVNRTNNGNGNTNSNAYISRYQSGGTYQSTIVQGLGASNAIAIDSYNYLYVAEGSDNGGNNTAAQYTTTGGLSFSLASTNLANPVGVAVDGSGNIYVLDNTNKNVTKYNSSGTYLSTVITGLNNPYGICTDGAGRIYIGDSGTGSVKVYDGSGTLLTSITGLTDPRGLAIDNSGNLYVSDYTNGTVKRYPLVGGYSLSDPLPSGLSFNVSTGVFSGTPAVAFSATTYTVTAYNSSGSGSTTVTLSCTTTAPVFSYSPSVNVFTTGTAITALTPTFSSGSSTSFSISPTLPTGLNFSLTNGNITGTPTATSVAQIYTVTASGSATATLSIACVVDNYWTGNNSTTWSTSNNWSAHHPPTSSTERASIGVIDYTSGNDPIVTASASPYYVIFGAARSATLTVNTGATLTINNSLVVNNNATPTVTGAGTGAINIASNATLSVNGTGKLTISSPLTFTLLSDATGSASVTPITTGLITGNVSVQRYITGGSLPYRGYRLLSSPIYGSTVSSNNVYSVNYLKTYCFIKGTTGPAGGFDAAGNPNIYLYRENLAPSNASFTSGNFRGINTIGTAPNYTYLIDGDAGSFNIPTGNGYLFFFRGDRTATSITNESSTSYVPTSTTVTTTGTLNQGQITVKNWYTPSSSNLGFTTTAGNSSIQGFNLIGNPYASSIDWDTYSTSSSTAGIYAPNVYPFIYILDPVSKNYNVYGAGNAGIGTIANSNSNIVPSGQGFFVQATNASAQVVFNETAKTLSQANSANGNLFLGKPPVTAVSQYLNLKLSSDSVNTDGILIGFNSTANPKYDATEDAIYRSGNGSVHLSSMSADNIALAINKMPLPRKTPLVIPLHINGYANGQYRLNMATIKGVPDLYEIWLMDRYKKDSLDIKHNPAYAFDIAVSDTNSYGMHRFSLVIRQNAALMVHILNFTGTKVTSGTQLVWTTENEQNYTYFAIERSSDGGKTFDVLGGPQSNSQGTYSFLDNAPPLGTAMYRLKTTDLNGTITYSKAVTLMYTNTNNKLAINNLIIYPNPTARNVNLTIAQTTGKPGYNIEIVNNIGTIVKSGFASQASWLGDVSNLLPGTYFIRVLNTSTNSLVGKSSFVKL